MTSESSTQKSPTPRTNLTISLQRVTSALLANLESQHFVRNFFSATPRASWRSDKDDTELSRIISMEHTMETSLVGVLR